MNHYVYYSFEEWGRGYIGVRSCKCSPDEDVLYMGSFYDKTFKPTQKLIISSFETREEALTAEITLHKFFEVDINKHFANKSRQTSTRFVCCGPRSEQTKQKMSNAMKGRKMSAEHIKKASIARGKKLRGRKFSEQHKKRLSEALKGRKMENHNFKGRLTKRSRKVVLRHISTGIVYVFGSISKASEGTGIKRANIYAMFKKPHLLNKGYEIVLGDPTDSG